MRKEIKVLLIGLGVLIVFDVLTELPFLKPLLSIDTVFYLTLLIYFGIAYEGARSGRLRRAIQLAAIVCVFDSLFTPGLEFVFRSPDAGQFKWVDWLEVLLLFYLPWSVLVGLLAAGLVALTRVVKKKA
jgi:hypothetical protein